MDVMPAIQVATQFRGIVRDYRGVTLGTYESQRLTGKLVARDARGIMLGSYNSGLNETRDAKGRLIGKGNLLGAILLRGRS